MNKTCVLFFSLLFVIVSCTNFPKDPDQTLEKVKNDTLKVGYSENPPWIIKTSTVPAGIEANLIKAFAKSLHATILWKHGSEQTIFESLEKKEIHLVMAGITQDTPWNKKVGLTRPYIDYQKKKHVMAVPLGENAFLVQLEKFLEEQQQQIKAQVDL